jgi:hypothetical protein
MSRHEWEDAPRSTKLWEDVDCASSKSSGWGPARDPSIISKQTANREFLSMLEWLWMTSTISAEQCCTLAFFAHLGGMSEEVGAVGLGPNKPSGHYSRHLKAVYGIHSKSQDHYSFSVPGHHKHDYSRSSHLLQVQPLHEAVEKMVCKDPEMGSKLQAAVDSRDLPPNYFTHPIVQASPTPPLPLSLYIDALPYSITDSVIAIWIQNILTEERALLALIRKRFACRCGCRSWCTFYPIMHWLRYCLRAMAHGKWPTSRHDDEPWHAQDAARQAKAGQPLSMKGVLLQFRGDWAEFCERRGNRNRQNSPSATRPNHPPNIAHFVCLGPPPTALHKIGVAWPVLPPD